MQESKPQTNPDRLNELLAPGVRSRRVRQVNGLDMHVLEAGFDNGHAGRLLLLHGFPELAFSWRHVMLPLADAGYHVVAPDQRGYGKTTGWQADYDADLSPFRIMNLVRDKLALLAKLGWRDVDAVIGHDFGSPVAAHCALIRPDVFKSVVLMSAPFEGAPAMPGTDNVVQNVPTLSALDADLASLNPPRKHYQHYYCERGANQEMCTNSNGLTHFLRAYYHFKSADWEGNQPVPLSGWDAAELARMPTYYIMNRAQGMAESVAPHLPAAADVAQCQWLTEAELAFYALEFGRTGFQGGLNWYRCALSVEQADELRLFSGRTIDVPAYFLAGEQDWGIYQRPGALRTMQDVACTRMSSVDLIPGAGHWVQQEQPTLTVQRLLGWLQSAR